MTEKLTASFPMTATADLERRTISGVLAPYGELGHASLGPVIFEAGSLAFRDHVVLLSGHDHEKPIGLLAARVDDGQRVSGAFKIPETPGGDQGLLEAATGLRNGLSVGVEILEHSRAEDGTLLVQSGEVYEVSLVTFPAFNSARVEKVAASHTPEATPAEDTTPASEEIPVDQSTVVAEAAAPVPAYVPRAHVQDAFPYRESTRDDRGMQASFFRDMLRAAHDPEAAHRHHTAATMMTAANDQADVNEIIPGIYRPDLYVDQLPNYRVTIDSFSKFSIDGPNIVRVPKFNSSSGLMSDHVENTNPTTGAFTTTEATVTPVAKSGLYDASREMIEGSTPAVDQLILQAIREEYALDTEAYAITTLLAAATAGTVVDISNGVTMQVLARMVTFQAARKRAAEVFLAGTDLFPELVAQVDGALRPMNPVINPANAPGTVSNAAMSVSVAGLTTPYVPVLTGGVLGCRADFATFESGLRTWRWEEVAGPAKIRLSAFGYIACVGLRAAGLLKFATQA
jgi:HK97 family phage prohead protease